MVTMGAAYEKVHMHMHTHAHGERETSDAVSVHAAHVHVPRIGAFGWARALVGYLQVTQEQSKSNIGVHREQGARGVNTSVHREGCARGVDSRVRVRVG